MKYVVDIDDSDLVEKVLLGDIETLTTEIERLQNIEDRQHYQTEDMEHCTRFRKNIIAALEYYMVHDKYLDLVEKYKD